MSTEWKRHFLSEMNLLQRLVLAIAALRTVVRTATAQLLCDELSALQTFSFCEELVCTTPWSESIPAQGEHMVSKSTSKDADMLTQLLQMPPRNIV